MRALMKMSLRKLGVLAGLALLVCQADAADEVKLAWKLAKGDTFTFKIHSVIEASSTDRREAKLEGKITLKQAPEGKPASGRMLLTKLYAIKSGSGSGARADAVDLETHSIPVKMNTQGRIFVDPKRLNKLEEALEDALEDISLMTHFQTLFFELPEKPVAVGATWKKFMDNTTFEFKLKSVDDKKVAVLEGKPKPVSDSETAKGLVTVRFDLGTGTMVSYEQKHSRERTTGSFIKSTTRSAVTRTVEITRGKAKAE